MDSPSPDNKVGNSAYLDGDVEPASLACCAARTVARWMHNNLDALENAEPAYVFPTDTTANQSIFDAMRNEGAINDRHMLAIMRCFGDAALSNLNLRRSNLTVCSLNHYLQIQSHRLNQITSLSLPQPPSAYNHLQAASISDLIFKAMPHLEVLDLGTHSELLYWMSVPEPGQPGGLPLLVPSSKIRALTVYGSGRFRIPPVRRGNNRFFSSVSQLLPNLCYFDLSFWDLTSLKFLQTLKQLTFLVLHDVPHFDGSVEQICELTSLRGLDLSQTNRDRGLYPRPTVHLIKLVKSLPDLEFLDISGTNLPGNPEHEEAERYPESRSGRRRVVSDIVGLRHLKRPLRCLGLFNCDWVCCELEHLPAERVIGSSDWNQLLTAMSVYQDRDNMLCQVISEAQDLLFEPTNVDLEPATECLAHFATIMINLQEVPSKLRIFIESLRHMLRSLHNEYLVDELPRGLRIRLVRALTISLERHIADSEICFDICYSLSCLPLCHDVPYELNLRMVKAVIKATDKHCQKKDLLEYGFKVLLLSAVSISLQQKEAMGRAGIIRRCLQNISGQLNATYIDADVMITVCYMLWILTDECPANSEQFLVDQGMEVFCKVHELSKNFENENNSAVMLMSGAVASAAEVPHLKERLLQEKYMRIFVEMLDQDFSPENSLSIYTAGCILAHLMAEVCASETPAKTWLRVYPWASLEDVEDIMLKAIKALEMNEGWKSFADDSRPSVESRTLRPVIELVANDSCRIAQVYGTCLLAGFTNQTAHNSHVQYCGIVQQKGALPHLLRFINDFQDTDCKFTVEIVRLSHIVLENLKKEEWRWNYDMTFPK